jgi:hypothetical protein
MSNSQLLRKRGGPKTFSGKLRSSRNSRIHGFFACEFSFSGTDEAEFTKLRMELRGKLKPDDALLDLVFEDVVACAWRIRVALRYEQLALNKEFVMENDGSSEESREAGIMFPYCLKTRKNEQAVQLIDAIRAEIEQTGRLRPEFEKEVCQIFGPEFWKILSEEAPQNKVIFWLSHLNAMTVERYKIFGMEPEKGNVLLEVEENVPKEAEVICKILDVYKNILSCVRQQFEGRGELMSDKSLARLDLSMRYVTTARREFYRSLREYQEAKKSN